jgi:hypothetical protein
MEFFVTAFIVAMVVTGVTEWLKTFFPEKLKENKIAMAIIAGILGGGAAALVAFTGIYPNPRLLVQLLFIAAVVGLTQSCYTLLFKTFKAVKEALTNKFASKVDQDKLADEIAEKLKGATKGK